MCDKDYIFDWILRNLSIFIKKNIDQHKFQMITARKIIHALNYTFSEPIISRNIYL